MKLRHHLAAALAVASLLTAGYTSVASASFICSLQQSISGSGTCWNENDSNTDSSGDFRNDAGWVSIFVGGSGSIGDWTDLDFLTTGLVASQFSTESAFDSQDPSTVETILEGSDWFNQNLALVNSGDISGSSFSEPINGNLVYIHTNGYSMAFLFDDIPSVDFFIENPGKGLSNYRIYSTETSNLPEPGTLPLLFVGLGALGWLRLRQTAA